MDNNLDNINKLTGKEFENFCKVLLIDMGFRVKETKITNDGGIDLIACYNRPLFAGRYIIQCKRYIGQEMADVLNCDYI